MIETYRNYEPYHGARSDRFSHIDCPVWYGHKDIFLHRQTKGRAARQSEAIGLHLFLVGSIEGLGFDRRLWLFLDTTVFDEVSKDILFIAILVTSSQDQLRNEQPLLLPSRRYAQTW